MLTVTEFYATYKPEDGPEVHGTARTATDASGDTVCVFEADDGTVTRMSDLFRVTLGGIKQSVDAAIGDAGTAPDDPTSTMAEGNGPLMVAQNGQASTTAPVAPSIYIAQAAGVALKQERFDATALEAAQALIQAGVVRLTGNDTALVDSRSQADTRYEVNLKARGCQCEWTLKNPQGKPCSHRVALWLALYGQVLEDKANGTTETKTKTSKPKGNSMSQKKPKHQVPGIPDEYIIELHGKPFVLYKGLLAMAHKVGLLDIGEEFTHIETDLVFAKGWVKLANGTTGQGQADATPDNVSSKVRPHYRRMALTRAKARALRDALGIGITCWEELDEA